MSRIDTAMLNMTLYNKTITTPIATTYDITKSTLFVYATNYNVLRILSGMGGLAYSN